MCSAETSNSLISSQGAPESPKRSLTPMAPVITGAIGVKDRFGDSGAPWELIKEFEVSAEHIAQKAMELMKLKKRRIVCPVEPDLITVR